MNQVPNADPNQAPNQGGAAGQGQAPAGDGQQQPNQNPSGLSDDQLRKLEGSLYSKFQSSLAKAENTAKEWEEKYNALSTKLSSFENIDELERRHSELQSGVFEAEAKMVRANLVEKEFPQLKGREQFIPLGTQDAMKRSAESLVKEFGLSSGSQAQDAPSLKTGAASSGGSVNLDALRNMSEEELKETAKSMSAEDLRAILAGAPPVPMQSKHSASLGSSSK